MSVYDTILERIAAGAELRTPDKSTGKPFTVRRVGQESVTVQTARGGNVQISPFTFDTAVKYLQDLGCKGENWLEVKD